MDICLFQNQRLIGFATGHRALLLGAAEESALTRQFSQIDWPIILYGYKTDVLEVEQRLLDPLRPFQQHWPGPCDTDFPQALAAGDQRLVLQYTSRTRHLVAQPGNGLPIFLFAVRPQQFKVFDLVSPYLLDEPSGDLLVSPARSMSLPSTSSNDSAEPTRIA